VPAGARCSVALLCLREREPYGAYGALYEPYGGAYGYMYEYEGGYR
jgi:hypothetical protein